MDIDVVWKTRSLPPQACYQCEEANHLVRDCPHCLDIPRLKGGINQRFDGSEGCSRGRGSMLHPRGGFCLVQLVKSVPWLLSVNRFSVLNIKEVNTDVCKPIFIPLPSPLNRKALPQRPKWKKRLPKQLSTNHPRHP